MKKINLDDLVLMDRFTQDGTLAVDLPYARADHPENIFAEAIYRPDAGLWLHRLLADVTLLAARRARDAHGWTLVLRDGLRTLEAQQKMMETSIVRRNPHWLEEPDRLLAPPGKGGHPRAMAIDITARSAEGSEIDFGTPFDYLTEDRSKNPAARNWKDLSPEVLTNRRILESLMVEAAADLATPLLPLPSEWWDFRLPASIFADYAPLSDAELPPPMRMTALTA